MKLAVLISGGGTTLVNLQDHIRRGTLPCEIALVVGSNQCLGVERAKDSGLNTAVVRRGSFQSVETFSDAIFEKVRAAGAEAVVLAGFLSLIQIPDDFANKVVNIHPSLIPAFCGQGFFGHKVHEAAIDRGVKVSGCTVHFADNAYDHGPIILQRTVSIPDGATPEELATLVFEEEKIAYPDAIRLLAEGRLKIEDRRVMVLPDSVTEDERT
ncbi:MAG: phosphoribosylglycinamide formyltransferase [Planctomycetaceae bacterium]